MEVIAGELCERDAEGVLRGIRGRGAPAALELREKESLLIVILWVCLCGSALIVAIIRDVAGAGRNTMGSQ